MSLWHESFRTLRRRFEAAAAQHAALYCVMVERSSPSGRAEYADFPSRKPSPDALFVGGGAHLYGEPKIVGNDVLPPRVREWQCYGKPTALRAFEALARDAGGLLVSGGPHIPDCLAAETLVTDSDSQRWLWAMFDLAWNPVEGSPLVATRMAWHRNVSMPLAQVENLRRMRGQRLDDPIGLALAVIPDPPDAFYSIIEDLLAVSCYAIHRLEQHAKRIDADTTEDKVAVSTDWRDVQRRLLEMCDKGEPYTNLRDLIKRTGCGSTSTVSKAINRSTTLSAWKARHTAGKTTPRASSLTKVHLRNTAQSREPNPAEEAEADDVDIIFARLIQEVQPDERTKLSIMTSEQRRQMADLLKNDPDNYTRILGRKP